jgi:hypothetical protein
MPDQVADLIAVDRPVVCDTGDPAQGVIDILAWCIHLADDRVFGAVHRGERRHRRAHTVAAVVMAHRVQRPRWVR